MKITDIEIIPIYPRLAKRNEDKQIRFRGINHRTIYKVYTDKGLVGYGDYRATHSGPTARSRVEPLIGCNPFDFIMADLDPGLAGALYDVMGKYLEVPVYKLMGQKVRDAVSVAAWTRPSPPEDFRDEILRAAAQGYTIFKMHTCPYYDVIEQTRAAEEVAPADFKIHWDFNGTNRTPGAVLPIIRELESHPIVGWIEDPLLRGDIDGWRRLRKRTRFPLINHVLHLGGLQQILFGVADAYIIGDIQGGGIIGETLKRGITFGRANIQTLIQLTGGTLTKALALHMAAVLPTATGHSINLDDQYGEDITIARIPVIEGYSPVPEAPGLGYEVDEDALAQVAANKPAEMPKHVGILHLPGGHKIHTPSYPDVARLTGREEGTVRGINFELWEDDGSSEFAQIYERVHKQALDSR